MKIKSLHPIVPGRKLNVCAYARISNDKEIAETSLEEQIDYYTSVIIDNPGWSFAGIYADNGISGTTTEARPQFKEMIEKALLGYIDIILVKSVSRFARNVIDLLNTIRDLKEAGVEVIFEEQNNLSTYDNKCDVILTLHSKFAEEEPKSMSANIQWYYEKKFNNGDYDLPHNLYGYGRDSAGKPIIIEEEAKWIRKIFEIYISTSSTTEVVNYLIENKSKTRTGSEWTPTKVRNILRNEKYCGNALLQKGVVEDVLKHKRIKNTGQVRQVLVTGGHPAIVSQEIWDEAQRILDSNKAKFNIKEYLLGTKKANSITMFTGYAYCPHCGSNFRLKTNHYNGIPTNKFLVCSSNQTTKKCKADNVSVEVFEKAIIKELLLLKTNISTLKKELEETILNDEELIIDEEIKKIDDDIEMLRNKALKYKDKFGDFYDEIKKEINLEIRELAKRKHLKQNDKAIASSSGYKIKKIIDAVKAIPSDIVSLDEFDFKQIFPRAVIKRKDQIILIIGNENIKGNKKFITNPLFNTHIDYKVRKTMFTCKVGIVINK